MERDYVKICLVLITLILLVLIFKLQILEFLAMMLERSYY